MQVLAPLSIGITVFAIHLVGVSLSHAHAINRPPSHTLPLHEGQCIPKSHLIGVKAAVAEAMVELQPLVTAASLQCGPNVCFNDRGSDVCIVD